MFSYAVKVDVGNYETHNDDRALVGFETLAAGETSGVTVEDHLLAAVCDGVGGLAGGYIAAETTLEFMKNLNRSGVEKRNVRAAIENANQRVLDMQRQPGLPDGMRTTLAGVYADAQTFLVFNVGDSRVYRFRHSAVTQLSKDHSLVQDLLDLGEITEEEAKVHPQKNIINKCIGDKEYVQPRILDLSGDLIEGDILLLCSDGISDVLWDADLKDVLWDEENDSLSECCREICKKAIEKGSRDNMSVILVRKEG